MFFPSPPPPSLSLFYTSRRDTWLGCTDGFTRRHASGSTTAFPTKGNLTASGEQVQKSSPTLSFVPFFRCFVLRWRILADWSRWSRFHGDPFYRWSLSFGAIERVFGISSWFIHRVPPVVTNLRDPPIRAVWISRVLKREREREREKERRNFPIYRKFPVIARIALYIYCRFLDDPCQTLSRLRGEKYEFRECVDTRRILARRERRDSYFCWRFVIIKRAYQTLFTLVYRFPSVILITVFRKRFVKFFLHCARVKAFCRRFVISAVFADTLLGSTGSRTWRGVHRWRYATRLREQTRNIS